MILSNWERREKTLIQQLFPVHRQFTFTNDDMEIMLCTALMAFTKPCFRSSVLLLSKYQSNININRKNKNIRIFCLQNVDID